jgi:hypothetical protein
MDLMADEFQSPAQTMNFNPRLLRAPQAAMCYK